VTTLEDELVAFERLQQLVLSATNEDEAKAVAAELRAFARRVKAGRWEPYQWQHPHTHPPGWVSQRVPGKPICDERCHNLPPAVIPTHGAWLQRGGRGTGKTEGAAHYVNSHVEGPACDPRAPGGHRLSIVAPTQADAVSACVEGISGLKAINPGIVVTTNREGTTARWPSGAVAKLVGGHTTQDVERLRAWSNVCLAWVEEAAAIPRLGEVLDQLPFTLRLAETPTAHPHSVITTTPKNRPEVVALIDGAPGSTVQRATVQTWGRTEDAFRLLDEVRAALEARYRGTTEGRQELDGELVGDVEGALWVADRPDLVDGQPNPDDRPGLKQTRLPAESVGWTAHGPLEVLPPALLALMPPVPAQPHVTGARRAVGVDPAGGATENGISVVAAWGNQGGVLADLSLKAGPDTWGRVAVAAYYYFGAEGIALERTFGGDQTEHVIATAAEALGLPMPPLLKAPTPEGKKERALPLVALAQQKRFGMIGNHPVLEGELTTWVEDETPESPNRLDAMVHAGRHLLVRAKPAGLHRPRGRIPGR
jgi:phage terminase large subunit-like protein